MLQVEELLDTVLLVVLGVVVVLLHLLGHSLHTLMKVVGVWLACGGLTTLLFESVKWVDLFLFVVVVVIIVVFIFVVVVSTFFGVLRLFGFFRLFGGLLRGLFGFFSGFFGLFFGLLFGFFGSFFFRLLLVGFGSGVHIPLQRRRRGRPTL